MSIQVSQGSAETLFKWKTFTSLHDFVADLFGKLCTKFYQNRLSYIEDIF